MNKMNLKQVLHILYGLGASGLLFTLLGALLAGVSRLVGILAILLGVLLMIAAVVFNIAKYRCPHCGENLGRAGGKYCPHCGHHLVDLE